MFLIADLNLYLIISRFIQLFNMNPLQKRLGKTINVNSRDERINLVQKINNNSFFVQKSCIIGGTKELGLFANQDFQKNDLVGIYNGILCKYSELKNAFRSKKKYDSFLKKYNIQTDFLKKETQNLMLKLSFRLTKDHAIVMPKYPIDKQFYINYNPMLYVNEPSDKKTVLNPHLNEQQKSEINVLAFTNNEFQTVDYIASRDIKKGEEILVYYGNFYDRDYNINQ